MKITVTSLSSCQQCKMVKKLLEKYNLVYDVEEHIMPESHEYPLIKINGTSYDYHDFLRFVKEGGLNKKEE